MNRHIYLTGVALALTGLLAGCSNQSTDTQDQAAIVRPVLSMVVSEVDPTVTGPFIGTVESRQEVSLGFKQSGRMIARFIDAGDQVKTGDAIATLDSTVLSLNVDEAKADLANAEAVLENAQNSYERISELVKRGSSSQSQLDAAKASLNSAKAQRKSASTALDLAQQNLADAELDAPFAGIITSVSSEVGEVVDSGQEIAALAKPDVLDAVIDVPEQYALQLERGDQMNVALKVDPELTNIGTVREIGAAADSYARTREVRLGLSNVGEMFRIGSMVSVTPVSSGLEKIVVPATAILDEDGKDYVWVVDKDTSKVEKREVTLGTSSDDYAVVSDGISVGERVAIAGVHSLQSGQQVAVLEN